MMLAFKQIRFLYCLALVCLVQAEPDAVGEDDYNLESHLSAGAATGLGSEKPEATASEILQHHDTNLEPLLTTEPDSSSVKYAVDIRVPSSVHLTAPYLFDGQPDLDSDTNDLLKRQIMEYLEFITKTLSERIGSNKCRLRSLMSWSSTATGIISMIKRHNKEQKKLKPVSYGKVFMQTSSGMFRRMMDDSKKQAVELAEMPKDPETLKRDIADLLTILRECISASPVAHFIDWEHIQMDEEKFYDVVVSILARLRINELSSFLSILDQAVSFATNRL